MSNITIINPNNPGNLSAIALAQLVPSNVKLPVTSQYPAITLVVSSTGQPVGISGYAQGYASILYGNYDIGSNNFNNNVSKMTIGQLLTSINDDSSINFGAIDINYSTLNYLIANNLSLYTTTTVLSPDIQSAMMTDLAILRVSQSSISYAQSTYALPGISDALAYYAAKFGIDPSDVLELYSPNDIYTTMATKFSQLKDQLLSVQHATIYAVVNGLPMEQGGLGSFQGFNSWFLYPTNLTGTDELGQPIQNVTIPGRGNNQGVTDNSQTPINAIAYGLSQLNYLTQQSLRQALQIISTMQSNVAAQNSDILTFFSDKLSSALLLTPSTTTYTTIIPKTNESVALATKNLTNAYDAYQSDPNNPILAATLDTTICNYTNATSGSSNLNTSLVGAYTQLNLGITPLSNVSVSNYNSFPTLEVATLTNTIDMSANALPNTSVQGITLEVATSSVRSNIMLAAIESTIPSFVTNPQLAMIATTGQETALLTTMAATNANVTLDGSQLYQASTSTITTI